MQEVIFPLSSKKISLKTQLALNYILDQAKKKLFCRVGHLSRPTIVFYKNIYMNTETIYVIFLAGEI